MTLTKLTLKIYSPLLANFEKQLATLHIKRDAFLESMIRAEVPNLAGELTGKRLSSKARRYIAGELKRLGTTQINVQVEKSTADLLHKLVEQTNIVRDAFVNRLIMFLRGSKQLLDYLDLPQAITYSEFEQYVEPMPTSALRAIETVHADPLYYLRAAVEERQETGIYLLELPVKFAGFACYIEDSEVPGTPEYEQAQRKADEMLALLDTVETEAFATPKAMEKQS